MQSPDEVLRDLNDPAVPQWQPVEAKPTRAQRQAEIQQEASAVTETIQKTLEEGQGKEYVFPALDLLAPPSGEGAKAAHQEGITLRQAVLATGLLSEAEYDALVDPEKMV